VRTPRPWLFGLVNLQYGIFSGVVTTTLPFVLRARGVSVEQIGAMTALVLVPGVWYFLWSPLMDIGLRRRTWLVVVSVVSGLAIAVAMGMPVPRRLTAMTVLLVGGFAVNQLGGSALCGLVAETLPNSLRGQASGWIQAANLGGAALFGGLLIWLASRVDAFALAIVAGLLVALPGFPALAVREGPPAGRDAREHFTLMLRDIKQSFADRRVWLGVALFVSPIGAGALTNLFSAIATDYGASDTVVIWAAGIGAGLITAAGALCGGFVCDRYDRWFLYPICGLMSAAAAGFMFVAPLTVTPYAVGAAAYSFASGFGYATFSAIVFELLGPGGAAASTRGSMFIAAANLPLAYMTWIDGIGHTRYGVRGLLAFDAMANVVPSFVLLALFLWPRFRPHHCP